MSVDFSRENLSSLMKDGVTEDLYKLLWAKDELNFSPMVSVPDTIIYKYGSPISWYFTSVNGHVKKKNKSNLVSAKIEEAFTKHILGYDVIAYFISMPSDHENQGSLSNTDFETLIEYFDRDGLKNFLYNHRKEVNGILQRFIEPKSTHNEIIRGIWSPKLCLLERAENIHALHDVRYGLYEKCVVYEGPDYYYTSAPLRGPVLSGQIQKLCEATVSHISEVTFGQKQVSRLVLNFKVDSRDKIWLLYSTSIRTIDMLEYNPLDALNGTVRNLVNIDSVVSLADSVHLNPKKSYSKIKPRIRIPCLSCAKEELEEMRHPVTYKSVIKHYDHILQLMKLSAAGKRKSKSLDHSKDDVVAWPPDPELIDTAGGVGFGCLNLAEDRVKHQKLKYLKDLQVPPIIGTLHPKLISDTYVRCKSDPLFLNKTVHVCEACYLVFAEFQTMLLQLGGNLTKLLTPDPAAGTIAIAPKSKTLDRPSSADWRAISSSMSHDSASLTTMSRSAMQHQQDAKDRAIGLRSSDTRSQPEVPENIRSPNYAHELNEFTFSTINTNELPPTPYGNSNASIRSGSAASLYRGGLLENDGNSVTPSVYDPQDVHAMIADRERRFFKEISLNPQLKDQHPLMHIISAQQKLKLVDQQSGVLMSKAASESVSVFGTKYGKQPGDKFNKLAPYTAEQPYIVNGEIILPSQLALRKKQIAAAQKEQRQRSIQSFLQADDESATNTKTSTITTALPSAASAANNSAPIVPAGDVGNSKGSAVDNNIKSSKKYRDFLSESLKKIQSDVEGAAPFRKTSHINTEVDENGMTIEPEKGKTGKDRESPGKSAQPITPLSEKERKTPTSAGHHPPLPSKKRLEDGDKSSRDYHTNYDLVDAPVFPIASNSQKSVPAEKPSNEKSKPSIEKAEDPLPAKEKPNAKVPIAKAQQPVIATPLVDKDKQTSTKPVLEKSNSKQPIIKASSEKAMAVDISEKPSTTEKIAEPPLAEGKQPDRVPLVSISLPTSAPNASTDAAPLSPIPSFVPGQQLEEDSSLYLAGSVDKTGLFSGGDGQGEEDGFSLSHSEAFAGLNDDQSVASVESLGNSLEATLSVGNSEAPSQSIGNSVEATSVLNALSLEERSLLQANLSKTLASEESLIKEQSDALLQMSGASLSNNDVEYE